MFFDEMFQPATNLFEVPQPVVFEHPDLSMKVVATHRRYPCLVCGTITQWRPADEDQSTPICSQECLQEYLTEPNPPSSEYQEQFSAPIVVAPTLESPQKNDEHRDQDGPNVQSPYVYSTQCEKS